MIVGYELGVGLTRRRELGVRIAGVAVRDAEKLFEMQGFCISGSET